MSRRKLLVFRAVLGLITLVVVSSVVYDLTTSYMAHKVSVRIDPNGTGWLKVTRPCGSKVRVEVEALGDDDLVCVGLKGPWIGKSLVGRTFRFRLVPDYAGASTPTVWIRLQCFNRQSTRPSSFLRQEVSFDLTGECPVPKEAEEKQLASGLWQPDGAGRGFRLEVRKFAEGERYYFTINSRVVLGEWYAEDLPDRIVEQLKLAVHLSQPLLEIPLRETNEAVGCYWSVTHNGKDLIKLSRCFDRPSSS